MGESIDPRAAPPAVSRGAARGSINLRPSNARLLRFIPRNRIIMEVSGYVKEMLDDARMYGSLEHLPRVEAAFLRGDALVSFEATLDGSFFNVYNQPCGYYQLKRFAAAREQALSLSFVEDAAEFRRTPTREPALRLQR